MPAKRNASCKDASTTIGFEAKGWLAADTFRRDAHPGLTAYPGIVKRRRTQTATLPVRPGENKTMPKWLCRS